MNRSFVINAMLLSYVQITDIQTDTTQACILNIYIYIYILFLVSFAYNSLKTFDGISELKFYLMKRSWHQRKTIADLFERITPI